MATGGGVVGGVIGSKVDEKEFVTKIEKEPGEIHIYPNQVYIKSNWPIQFNATIPTQELGSSILSFL